MKSEKRVKDVVVERRARQWCLRSLETGVRNKERQKGRGSVRPPEDALRAADGAAWRGAAGGVE